MYAIKINEQLRNIYTLTAFLYLFTANILYNKKYYFGFSLYLLCTILSIIWSYTSYGGMNGSLFIIDQIVAYMCVFYNLYNFIYLKKSNKLDNFYCCSILFIACLVYVINNYLIIRNIDINITFGIMRIIWRILTAYGTYLLYSS